MLSIIIVVVVVVVTVVDVNILLQRTLTDQQRASLTADFESLNLTRYVEEAVSRVAPPCRSHAWHMHITCSLHAYHMHDMSVYYNTVYIY